MLSGFLITGLLVSEYRQNAGIGLARFWGHRVRRLVPALLVMLVGVALYGCFLAPSDTLGQLRGPTPSPRSSTSTTGIRSAGGQGYFAALNTPRPLLHTWSLSIEEQFYLVWPLVVLGVLRWSRSLRALSVLTVAGAVASAVTMAVVYGNGSGESRAYYGTDTRAQALLIGAALAIVLAHPLPRRRSGPVTDHVAGPFVRPRRLRPGSRLVAVGRAGLVGSAVLSVVDTSATAWIYRGGFTLVALATAGIIASVALLPDSPLARVLQLRPVRYVGAISYGLYLFHWPIFVLVDNARTGLVGWPLFLVRVGLSFAAAAVSFHFLEMPVRRGVLRGWRAWVVTPLGRRGYAVALVVAATAGATTAVDAVPVGGVGEPTASTASRRGRSGHLCHRPDGAGRNRWPDPGAPGRRFRGQLPRIRARPRCAAHDVDYQGDGVFGCGLLYDTTLFHGTYVNGDVGERGGHVVVPCDTQLTRWKADVDAFHPDVVLLADGEYEVRNQLIGKHVGPHRLDRRSTNGRWRRSPRPPGSSGSTGAKVVLLTAPYYHQLEQADGQRWPEDDPTRVNLYNSMLGEVAKRSHGRVVVANVDARLDPGATSPPRSTARWSVSPTAST